MMPIKPRDVWLQLAGIELPDPTFQTTEKLDYDPLLSALSGSLQIATSHQQEASSSHQQQRKQQQQFVAENIEANKEEMARIKELLDKEKKESIATKDDSELIDIDIDFDQLKKSFTNDQILEMIKSGIDEIPDENPTIKRTLKRLATTAEIIKSVIGEIPNQEKEVKKILDILSILKPKYQINEASVNAIKKIVENYSYFVDGVALTNMPAGFFSPEIETSKYFLSLKFDSEAFDKIKSQKKDTHNSYDTNPILLGMQPAHEDSTVSITKDEIIEAISRIDDLPDLDDSIFDYLQFTEDNFKALAPVLNSEDDKLKTLALLKHLQQLKNDNPTLYDNIKTCFIDKSKNLLELANLETIDALTKLNELNPSQKEWWDHLVKQHTSDTGVGKSNFLELFHIFDAFYQDLNGFWQEIFNKDIELPIPCPIDNIGNMQVALNRIAYIVKHAAHPDDQLELLKELELNKIHREFLKENFKRKLGFLEPKSGLFNIFLDTVYSLDPEIKDPYIPKYNTACNLWEKIEEYIPKNTLLNVSILPKSVSQFLQREVQAKDIFNLLKISIPHLESNKAKRILNSPNYPLFSKEGYGIYLNPLYFKLAFTNPTPERLTRESIFEDIHETSAFTDKPEPPKADIFSCLLSINLENIVETVPETVNKLYELYETKPEALPILATILSHTDFEQTEKSDLTTKEQLSEIVDSCKTETEIDYKSIKKIVEEKVPNLKFLPDLEYAKTLINEAPKDLKAIIKIFEPIFSEIGITLDPDDISKSTTEIIEDIYNKKEDELELAKKLKLQLTKKLIEPNREKLQGDNDDNKIIGLIKIIETARNLPITARLPHAFARKATRDRLTIIKDTQLKNARAILKETGLDQEAITKLTDPIQSIDLSSPEKDLISQVEELIETTGKIKEFSLNYIQLVESEKWDLKPRKKKSLIDIVNENFDGVSENLGRLLNVYNKYPALTQDNFFSPNQLLEKILASGSSKTLTNEHISAIKEMAAHQASEGIISKKKLEKILDTALQLDDPEATDIVIEISLDQETYRDFPISDFLNFTNSFIKNGLKKEKAALKKHRSKTIEDTLKEKGKELKKNLVKLIKDLPTLYQERTDRKSLNALIRHLFINMSKNADIIPFSYLEIVLFEFDKEKQQQLFKIVRKISEREEETRTKNRNSLHINISWVILHLKNLTASDETLFEKINTIYDGSPCPNSSQLLELLKGKKDLETFKADFEVDPYGERIGKDNELNKSFYKKHFATDKVDFFITSLNKNGANLSETFLAQLRNDFLYINTIGSSSTSTFPNTEPPKPVWKMSKEELQEHLESCKTIIRNPEKSGSEKYLAKLQALALLRETMYRTTGKTANSTQIFSILLQIKHKRNLCMEIKTGEGKSITNPLLAAMEYLSGYSVNVFTSNSSLAKRDEEESHDFWEYLDIPTTFIARDSIPGSYLQDGVNYTTPGDFALYSAASKEEYRNMAGVYDESDLAFYETNVDFNFADTIGGEIQDPFHNPFAWAYPLILDFVDNEQTLLDELLTATDKNLAAAKIVRQLRLHLSTHPDSKIIKQINDNQLLKWVAAATSAYKLEEGTHFVVENMTRNEYGELKHYRKVCVINDEGHKIEGSVFANGIHQLLSARLQREQKRGCPFVIDNETFCVSSRSAHTELTRMKKIVGITGTFGHKTLRDKFKKYHDTLSLEIPRHFTNKRYDLPPRFVENYRNHLKQIKAKLLETRSKTLITCPNEEQCIALYESLKDFAYAQGKKLIIATSNGYKKYDPETEPSVKIISKEEALKEAHSWDTITITLNTKKQDLEDRDRSFRHPIHSDSSVYTRNAIKKELTKKIKQNQLVVFSSSQQCTTFFEEAKEFADRNKVNLILATAEGFKKYDWKTQTTSDIEEGIKEAVRLAGKERTVTISTAILGRGVNIRNLAKVITTYDPNERLESQVKGRTGRYGAKGITIGIYDWTEICQKYGSYLTEKQKSATKNKERRKAIKDIREKIQAEEISKLGQTFELKEISIRYQQYFDHAIENCEDPDSKTELLWKKNLLINKLAVLQKTVINENEKVDEQIASFETGAKEIWDKLIDTTEENIAEPLKKAEEQLITEKDTNLIQDTDFYSIRTLFKSKLSDDQLVSEYHSRNQIIYLDEEPNEEQITKLPEQLESDLSALLELLHKRRIDGTGIESLITKHIAPYFKFSEKWQDKGRLKINMDETFRNYVKNLTPKSNKEYLYLYYLSQAKILSENPGFKKFNIKNITTDEKEDILYRLHEHLNDIETKDRQTMLENIKDHKPTGDSIVDYYVTTLKKQRGWFHTKDFGETSSFKKIAEFKFEEIEEIPVVS